GHAAARTLAPRQPRSPIRQLRSPGGGLSRLHCGPPGQSAALARPARSGMAASAAYRSPSPLGPVPDRTMDAAVVSPPALRPPEVPTMSGLNPVTGGRELSERRVAIFLQDLAGGGAERTMVRLANGLAKSGCSVEISLVRAEGSLLP